MKLALAQLNPVIGDLNGNAEKIFEVCESIKNKDIDLVITPELSLIGYPPKDLYEIILIAQKAAIECVQPGGNSENIHMTALKHLVEGLVDIGLLIGNVDSIIEQQAYSHLYMHRTGHWLGLDVHDVGAYRLGDYHVNLENGMVLTVEPGIYISDRLAVPKGQPEIDERWKGIGIRIEDDVLVTKDSVEVLSSNAAKELIDLEY